ncbi:DNA-binding protein YbaB [Kitasatospora sp. MAP12-15]|uniref:YbaB/EbfC family nucleoid-associated protein n=1 Tax=unclassified Kitasatospora TaxID=2633591 RepID=UPI002474C73D|nr:YbaB/EbfC family nucleoid-associated protein [Kitasatospora sp. MAP12-44]MDH6109464.1 DNA-binding protein YbaB [Kitasatospora sp. MAP12-44]
MPDPGQPDLAALRQRAQHLYADMRDVQHELTQTQATGHDAGGLVAATVAADGRLLDLRIDSSVIDPEDPDGLAELVVAAVQSAHQSAVRRGAEQLNAVTSQLNGILDGIRQSARPAVPPTLPAFPAPPTLGARRRTAPARESAAPTSSTPALVPPKRPTTAFAPVREV